MENNTNTAGQKPTPTAPTPLAQQKLPEREKAEGKILQYEEMGTGKKDKKTLIWAGAIIIAMSIPLLASFFITRQIVQKHKESVLVPFNVHKSEGQNGSAIGSKNPTVATTAATQKKYTDAELLAMADNKYEDGDLPLGDGKYVTDGPKKGYIYLCHAQSDPSGGGSQVNGNWINGDFWNYKQKVSVEGSISWPNATFSNIVSGTSRVLSGNDLPLNHTTGIFPISSSDPAYTYDKNPNSISAQTFKETVPANPTYSDTPYCMGGEVGVMLSGVALFNGFDAGLRDAPAHEVQDSCDGHPQVSGEYHYHSLSGCFKDISEKTVLGYALDGFPITGPMMEKGKYLTTEDLDECHGITSEITVGGKTITTYHYVMTQDFPYSVSCFRSKASSPSGQGQPQPSGQTASQAPQQGQTSPQEAITACSGKTADSSCSFVSPHGDTISGHCTTPPGSSLACVPNN